MLERNVGFEVVGQHGADGFSEIDDECIVFSPFVNAPVNQIIADLGRPVMVICNEPGRFPNLWEKDNEM